MRTGLNVNFAMQCLEGNGWDLERAVANFLEVKVRYIASTQRTCLYVNILDRPAYLEMPS